MSNIHCRHSAIRKSLSRRFHALRGRRRPLLLKNGCPICGQLPAGDRVAEYVLTVWFVDGEAYEYNFRGRREDECFEINDSVLKIALAQKLVHYPLQAIGTIEFSAREALATSPEVREAERIISAPLENS